MALAELGLTQSAAARLLRVEAGTVGRWARGETRVPGTAEAFLRLLVTAGITGEAAIRLASGVTEDPGDRD
ncbi:helix-turn-helix domain-containing protein [Methylobacterium nodulans]|nr:hypothetical protein [Methylobacterium nodulans]